MFSKEQHRGNLSLQKLNRGDPILLKVKIFQTFRKVMKFPASVNYIHYIIYNLMSWSIYNILFNCLSYGRLHLLQWSQKTVLPGASLIYKLHYEYQQHDADTIGHLFVFVLDSTLSYFLQASHIFVDVSPISSSSAY